jgi:hypothetical protein
MQAIGLVTREKMMTPGTKAYQQGLEQYDPLAKSASGYVWMMSNSKDRFAEIAVGRAYARLNLRATALGIAIHPCYFDPCHKEVGRDPVCTLGPARPSRS